MTTTQGQQARAVQETFREQGFCVLQGVVDDRHAAAMRDRLDALLGPVPASAPAQEVIPRLVERDEMFANIATAPGMLATVFDIFGAPPLLACSYGHRKPPRTPAHTGPHSDVAHLRGVPHNLSLLLVKAMIALTPVNEDSGPTVLFPGTHQGGDASHKVPIMLDVGDMVLFHANIRHSASANSSESSRLSLWFVFAQPWMRIFPGYEFSPDFLTRQRSRMSADPQLRHVFGLADPYAT